MAQDYTVLIAAWNAAPTLPTGVTGNVLTGPTGQKIQAINGWTILGPPQEAVVRVIDIVNAIQPADLIACTNQQIQVMQFMFQGAATVFSPPGSTIRVALNTIFAGKTTTLANIHSLHAGFDTPQIQWVTAPVASGGAGLSEPVSHSDLDAAGGLS